MRKWLYTTVAILFFAAAPSFAGAPQTAKKPAPINLKANAYKKSVRFHLALRSPAYDRIMATSKYDYLYPQQICLDEQRHHLFVVFAGRGSQGDKRNWVHIYDWVNGKFITAFAAGTGLGETCVVSQQQNKTFLWVKVGSDRLAAFDITTLPKLLSKPKSVREHSVGINYQSAYLPKSKTWLIEDKTPSRQTFSKRDANFKKIGSVKLATAAALPAKEPPKRQSLAAGSDFLVGAFGRNYIPGRDPDTHLQGVTIFDPNGKIRLKALVDPRVIMAVLNEKSIPASRIENEGVLVVKDRIYTLMITQSANSPKAKTGGMLILREFSPGLKALDFSRRPPR